MRILPDLVHIKIKIRHNVDLVDYQHIADGKDKRIFQRLIVPFGDRENHGVFDGTGVELGRADKVGYVSLNERYTFNGKVKYKLDNASLDIWRDKIRGSLSLYSLSQKEPERPMYMELYRDGNFDKDKGDAYNYIGITPNPFDSQFDAIFELKESSAAIVRVFDKFGMLVWQQDLGTLEAGKHRITLCPDIRQGYHVLNISAGKQALRTIIVKKGGE